MISSPYEFIAVQNFERELKKFHTGDQNKILAKVREMLGEDPYRYEMLAGPIPVSGINLTGLHRMKVGVKGNKGGAYVLYRICEECKKNSYMTSSGRSCEFCDAEKLRHVVLFVVRPRPDDYGR